MTSKPPGNLDFRWSRSRLWQVVLLTLGCVAILIIIMLGTSGTSRGKEGNAQPTEVSQSNPDDLMAKSLSEKEAIEQRIEAAINQAQAAPPARGDRPADLESGSDPEFQTGILTGVAGPFSSQDIVVSNLWQEEIEGGFMQVFAGAAGTNPQQGILVIIKTGASRLVATEDRYPSPDEQGALFIIQVDGDIMELKAEDGASLFFDLEAREYVQPR